MLSSFTKELISIIFRIQNQYLWSVILTAAEFCCIVGLTNVFTIIAFAFAIACFLLFLFVFLPAKGLWNCKSVFLNLKIWQYGGSRRWVQHFHAVHPCKIWHKNWYLHFYKTYDHQIWQAGSSTGFDSNETNQAGAGEVITSISCDKLKAYLHSQSAYENQTWQDCNLPWLGSAHKVT